MAELTSAPELFDLEAEWLAHAKRLCAGALAGVPATVRTILVAVEGDDMHLVVAAGDRPVMTLQLDSLICDTGLPWLHRRRMRALAREVLAQPELSPFLDSCGRVVLTTNGTMRAPSVMLDAVLERLATRRRRSQR